MENKLFEDLELTNEMKRAIKEMGFETATPVQSMAIVPILEGKDIIAQAPTGTGKTCAFGIPAIENIDPDEKHVQVLILCPTRELALQISQELQKLCRYKEGIKILPIYGGESIDKQIAGLRKKPQIIVGTPGRVMDHLRRRTLKLQDLNMVVLDEADEMLNMGFREDIDIILENVSDERQFVLFSATLPKAILDIANKYQSDVVKINTTSKVITVPTIEQFYLEVYEKRKTEVLSRLIDVNQFKLMVIFCNTKKRVDDLCKELISRGYRVEALHGDMKQSHRDSVMGKFRKGIVDILIATDVAARGIDVDDVDAVFNYDLPLDEEYYVHRIGRTGRANRKGVAYSFISGKEIYKLKNIQRYTKCTIERMSPPSIEMIKENKIQNIINDIKVDLQDEKINQYIPYIEEILKEQPDLTPLQVASAFLCHSIDELVIGSNDSLKTEDLEMSGRNNSDRQFSDKNHIRLFINLGMKDKLQSAQLIKLIVGNTSITGKEIGKIDMLEKFSFFEIPGHHTEELIYSLSKQKFKGRKINIEVANKKKRK
ncbi:MAG: RNA helicase [Epulopiscium sp. Nele67-Bin005]|nr:MAG: RNA helicase [Epulopiscium sp. Nele67-Bin005]